MTRHPPGSALQHFQQSAETVLYWAQWVVLGFAAFVLIAFGGVLLLLAVDRGWIASPLLDRRLRPLVDRMRRRAYQRAGLRLPDEDVPSDPAAPATAEGDRRQVTPPAAAEH